MSIIWHNGVYKEEEPVLYAHDRLRLGEGVFDVVPSLDGRLGHPELHFQKFLKAGDIFFGIWTRPDPQVLQKAAEELLARNAMTKGRYAIRTLITRGPAGDGIRLPETENLQIIMRASAVPESFPAVHAIIAKTVHRNEGSPLSQIKCANYGESVLALREAQGQGANEAIMLNNAGRVACATTSNIFMMQNGRLFTPPITEGTQEGITRRLLIEKTGAEESFVAPEELKDAEGVFLTNSVRGVVLVETLDGKKMPRPSLEIDKEFHLN